MSYVSGTVRLSFCLRACECVDRFVLSALWEMKWKRKYGKESNKSKRATHTTVKYAVAQDRIEWNVWSYTYYIHACEHAHAGYTIHAIAYAINSIGILSTQHSSEIAHSPSHSHQLNRVEYKTVISFHTHMCILFISVLLMIFCHLLHDFFTTLNEWCDHLYFKASTHKWIVLCACVKKKSD